jgi:hypothetical protein
MYLTGLQKLLVVTALAGVSLVGPTGIARAAAVNCNGDAQKAVLTTISTSNLSTASTTFEVIPGAAISVATGGAVTDTYVVTFAGEASATGGGNWEVEAQRSIDGGAFSLMPPVTSVTFQSGNKAAAHSMTWCNRVSATTSVDFQIVWRKIGGGTANIGAYTMQVQRSE